MLLILFIYLASSVQGICTGLRLIDTKGTITLKNE